MSKNSLHSDDAAAAARWQDTQVDLTGGHATTLRIYRQAHATGDALVVHFHGGAYVSGSLDSGATVAGLLADAGATVVSVDYPLARQQPFPAAVEVGHAALVWADGQRAVLAGRKARLFVAGEEAGGNLATAVAMMARDRRVPALAGQILVSPMLDARVGTASMREGKGGPSGCRWADGWCAYLSCGAAADHPYALPARALRLGGMPPALLLSADDDPLRDETLAYARRLEECGTPARCRVLDMATGWPCALSAANTDRAGWADAVRDAMREFLTQGPPAKSRQTP